MKPVISTVTFNAALDHTIYFSRFYPGQLNRVEQDRLDPAGKGINVAKVLKALGHEVTVTGFLGKDNLVHFEKCFAANAIIDRFIKVEGATRVNMKVVDGSKGEVTEINFSGVTCRPEDLAALEQEIEMLAQQQGVFVFAGSLPQGVPADIYGKYIIKLRQAGCKVFLDTSGQAMQEGIKAKPYAIKPNIHELSQITGKSLENMEALKQVIGELLAGGVEQVTVSLGSQGAMIASREGMWLAEPPQVKVKSTVGAGDAMVAGLVSGEVRGLPLPDRIRLATATAVAAVMQPGTQACSINDVEKVMTAVKVTRQ